MVNPLTTYGVFGWNYAHLLTHPHVAIYELYLRVKWFIQRGHKGYADCDVWSLDHYLAGWLPEALERLQVNKVGHPLGMTSRGWQTRLGTMRDGFLAVREIEDMNFTTPHESQILQRRMARGLNMFAKHFLSLWD